MTEEATWSGTLAIFARMLFHSGIIAVAVLAVDVIVLLFLNLLTNLGTWVIVLLAESVVLMSFGTGEAYRRQHSWVVVGYKRPSKTHVSGRPSKPWFAFKVAMAGLMMFILCLYLISQHYST
jgi:hypothetical protein